MWDGVRQNEQFLRRRLSRLREGYPSRLIYVSKEWDKWVGRGHRGELKEVCRRVKLALDTAPLPVVNQIQK